MTSHNEEDRRKTISTAAVALGLLAAAIILLMWGLG
jgi:hypothetical protein